MFFLKLNDHACNKGDIRLNGLKGKTGKIIFSENEIQALYQKIDQGIGDRDGRLNFSEFSRAINNESRFLSRLGDKERALLDYMIFNREDFFAGKGSRCDDCSDTQTVARHNLGFDGRPGISVLDIFYEKVDIVRPSIGGKIKPEDLSVEFSDSFPDPDDRVAKYYEKAIRNRP